MAQRRSNPGVRELDSYASYHALATYLGKKDARTIAHNTVVVRIDNEHVGVILHHTRIVTFDLDGNVTVNSGGYHTTTTKQRINQFLRPHGWSLSQRKYEWFVHSPDGEKIEFEDNMVIPLGSTVHPSSMAYRAPARKVATIAQIHGVPWVDDELRKSNPRQHRGRPGKFEGSGDLGEYLYDLAMESGADDEFGDSETFGYYWLFDGVEFEGDTVYAIGHEGSQGFFDVTEYDTAKELGDEWSQLSEEWEDAAAEMGE